MEHANQIAELAQLRSSQFSGDDTSMSFETVVNQEEIYEHPENEVLSASRILL